MRNTKFNSKKIAQTNISCWFCLSIQVEKLVLFFLSRDMIYLFNESAKSVFPSINRLHRNAIDNYHWMSDSASLLVSFSLEGRQLELVKDWEKKIEETMKYFIRSRLNYVVAFKCIASIPFNSFIFHFKENQINCFSLFYIQINRLKCNTWNK